MENLFTYAVTVIIISASGVMSPGPLFAANIFYGLKQGVSSGIKLAMGHTVVELPLVILLGFGIITLETIPEFRGVIAVVGAASLFVFAGLQIKTTFRRKENSHTNPKYGAFFAGVVFSAANPFFIIWWLTIGFKLISDALEIWSFLGIGIMFVLHIWMDYLWLGTIAFLSKKSLKILSNRNYKIITLALSGMLIYFGFTFLISSGMIKL